MKIPVVEVDPVEMLQARILNRDANDFILLDGWTLKDAEVLRMCAKRITDYLEKKEG